MAKGGFVGNLISGGSTKKPISAQKKGAAEARGVLDTEYKYQKDINQPYYETGTSANSKLATALGLAGGDTASADYGSLTKNYTGQDIYQDPSYAFRFGQGQKAIERQASAAGKYLTPEAQKALMNYGQDAASQEYQAAYNRYNQDQSNLYQRLMGISGQGQDTLANLQNASQNYAGNTTNIITGKANAIAASYLAKQANQTALFSSAIQGASQAAAAGSDINLKENIELVGVENGHNIYKFNYKDNPEKTYTGVMAQEVIKTHPDAVTVMPNGYYGVYYDKLGLEMREVQ